MRDGGQGLSLKEHTGLGGTQEGNSLSLAIKGFHKKEALDGGCKSEGCLFVLNIQAVRQGRQQGDSMSGEQQRKAKWYGELKPIREHGECVHRERRAGPEIQA